MSAKPNDKPSTNSVKRGKVTKTFQDVNVLAGFMDDAHFTAFAYDHIQTLSKAQQTALLKKVEAARHATAKLPNVDFANTEIRPLESKFSEKITKDKTFHQALGHIPHRFCWVDPKKLVALQVFTQAQKEEVPKNAEALVKYALPKKWSVPVEINFIPPLGPIYVVSSSPHMSGVEVSMDAKSGQVVIKPPSHINLVQLIQFEGRYYLRNGYHRVLGSLSAGIAELPALVFDAAQVADVEMPYLGISGFRADLFSRAERPPLVSDFSGPANVLIPMREKRYGASVSLQISPITIGV